MHRGHALAAELVLRVARGPATTGTTRIARALELALDVATLAHVLAVLEVEG